MNNARLNPPSAAIDPESGTRLAHRFCDDVRSDGKPSPAFDVVLHDRRDRLLPRMAGFWRAVMLGSRSLTGNVFGKRMAMPGVAPPHFRHWLLLWALYRGCFGTCTGFDTIESEVRHACR